jgi:uncharacterized membrane-anchored protein
MKTKLVLAAVVFQVLALAYMAAGREWILHTGHTIYLRTAPVDPRDAMRGDYVRLDYPISSVPRALWRDGLADRKDKADSIRPDTPVYATLNLDEDGMAELATLSDRRPATGVFLRGRTERFYSWNMAGALPVRYGLEAFFMQQGSAAEVERQRWKEMRGVPLIVEVAVGRDGTGVLKSHRWDALGVTLTFDNVDWPSAPRSAGRRSVIAAAKLVLTNHGPQDLAIVDLPGGRSFTLIEAARSGKDEWRWVGADQPAPTAQPENIIVLKPGQTHLVRIDLRDPAWFVEKTAKPLAAPVRESLSALRDDWTARFRFEYRPPNRVASHALPNALVLWHGRLPSRAFTPRGDVD